MAQQIHSRSTFALHQQAMPTGVLCNKQLQVCTKIVINACLLSNLPNTFPGLIQVLGGTAGESGCECVGD